MPKFSTPQPRSAPATPPPPQEIDPGISAALDTALHKLPDELHARLRDSALGVANARVKINRLEAAKTSATAAFTTAIAEAETIANVTSIPIVDPKDGQAKYAYLRVDEVLEVDPAALREGMFEYYKMRENEDDELAVIHAADIMEQVLKPPKVDNEEFRKLVKKKTIPAEVVASCSTLTPKTGWVDFEIPK